jgi:4-aminobutyrate aminotransferase-like enzyme
MAKEVALQIQDLERRGDGIAAFIVDSVFSSDGLFVNPTDLLAPVAEVVRKAGGLFIADEVQSGFGRTCAQLWGYSRHGVDPDIVTMGKPMGNGYPVAGAVFRSEVIEDFGRNMRYFNTFGGNTVAIAAARATLDTIMSPGLLTNADKVGKILLAGLEQLGKRYERIGDVRGAGLYFGVELVKDRVAKTTDIDTGLAIVNGLRDRGVLISATGPDANILKIRPQLIFSETNCDQFLDALESVLASLRRR